MFTEQEIKSIAKLFMHWGESPAAKKEWGEKLSVLSSEPGACSMVSNTFVKWLINNGFPRNNVKVVVGELSKKKHFKILDENAHTVVMFNNVFVVDFTAKQFDDKLEFPRFMKISEFKQEWSRVI